MISNFNNPLKHGYSFRYGKIKKHNEIVSILKDVLNIDAKIDEKMYDIIHYSILNSHTIKELNAVYSEVASSDKWPELLDTSKKVGSIDLYSSVVINIMAEVGLRLGLNSSKMTDEHERAYSGIEVAFGCEKSEYPLQPLLELHKLGLFVTFDGDGVYRVHALNDFLRVVYEGDGTDIFYEHKRLNNIFC